MRRTGLVLVSLSLLVAAAACGDSDSSRPADTTSGSGVVDTNATAPTSTVAKPTVSLPTELPTELVVTDLRDGSGPKAATGDVVVVHYVGVRSASGQEFDSNYDSPTGFDVQLGANSVIQGWEQGLIGVQQGTRRQLDIPADLAYGDNPPGGDVIQAGDALTFVVDVIVVLPGSKASDDPGITLDAAKNVDTQQITELIDGSGPAVQDGQTVAVRIVSYRADTGAMLASSWGEVPLTYLFSKTSDVYPGLVDAVAGMKVGGRRQVQIPYATVFDGAGNDNLGIPAAIDLTVVIDLVAVY